MDIITRNFFRLILSDYLEEQDPIEPMSAFKWQRLFQMVHTQHVEASASKGIARYREDEMMNIPQELTEDLAAYTLPLQQAQLSNPFLNYRLKKNHLQRAPRYQHQH